MLGQSAGTRGVGRASYGFSATEVLATLLIVGVLFAAAIPGYEPFTVKARASEALMLSSTVRARSHVHYALTGRWPESQDSVSEQSTRDEPVSGEMYAYLDAGAVHVRFGDEATAGKDLMNRTLSFRPALSEGDDVLVWMCGMASPPSGYRVVGENKSDVPPEYLLFGCR